jgi:hypothetical protein
MVALLKLFVGDRRAFWKTKSSADYSCAKKKMMWRKWRISDPSVWSIVSAKEE